MRIPADYWLGHPLFAAGLPWLTPGAIEVLCNITKRHFHVLEFGAGGSTRFFTARCERVVTWESDPAWYFKVKDVIPKAPRFTITHDLGTVWALDEQFDIVLVDSDGDHTDRVDLCRRALKFLLPDGWLILDNYARYKTPFLRDWNVWCYDDPHWSGRGTLFASYH